jgi:ADP-ribose pyrophosphatase
MPLQPWKTLSTSIKFKNPWWTYKLDRFELPSGKEGEYHYVHSNGSSCVVPVLTDGRIMMVKQYRYLALRDSIEFPCGAVKDGSTHDETAVHELTEETGYVAGEMIGAGIFNPYNGVTNEMCRVYIARQLRHVGTKPDETEEFEFVPMKPEEIEARILDGTIWDGMTIAAWMLVRGKLEIAAQF